MHYDHLKCCWALKTKALQSFELSQTVRARTSITSQRLQSSVLSPHHCSAKAHWRCFEHLLRNFYSKHRDNVMEVWYFVTEFKKGNEGCGLWRMVFCLKLMWLFFLLFLSVELMLHLYHKFMLHSSLPENQRMKKMACNTVDVPLKQQALEHMYPLLGRFKF